MRYSNLYALGGGVVLLLLVVWGSLSVGSAEVSFVTVWKIILFKLFFFIDGSPIMWTGSEEAIVWKIRFPRVIIALFVGAALSVAGVAFQGVLRNPLADPYVLGISSGSALGAASVIFLGWGGLFYGWSLPLFAFVGGLFSLICIYKLAQIEGKTNLQTIILAGVVIQSFFGAILSFILSLSGDRLQLIVFWLMGSFAKATLQQSVLLLPYVIIGSALLWAFANHLNVLSLGERQAQHLGMNVNMIRWVVLILASLLTAAAVSFSGTIGFVGLVVPHIIRGLFGANHRWLFPLSFIGGGIFMVVSDTIARMIMEPRELPIGVITALFGAPFFAYLLKKGRHHSA